MDNVYKILKDLNIPYTRYDHDAVFTVAEAKEHRIDATFGENKNLFLRNRKGDKHYLVTIAADKQLDLKKLAENFGEKSVGFASPERLQQYLHLTPGSVSPFGLINDMNKEIIFVLDESLLEYESLGFHPNINTQTVVLKTSDFKNYLKSTGNKVLYFSL